MADTIARDADRLPWLTDEKAPTRPSGRLWTVPLLVVGMVAIAVLSFWFGMTRSWSPETPVTESQPEAVSTPLPAPQPVQPPRQAPGLAPMREVEPTPAPAPVVIRMQEDVRPTLNSEPALKRVASPTVTIGTEPSAPAKVAGSRAQAARILQSLGLVRCLGPDGSCWHLFEPSPGQAGLGKARSIISGDEEASGGRHRHPVAAEWPCLLSAPDRDHFTGSFRSALPADEGDRPELRRGRPGGSAEGKRG